MIPSGHITSFLKVGEGVGVERTHPKKFDKHEKVVRTGLWSLWTINKIRSKLTKEKQFYSYYLIFVSICFTYKALPKKIGGGGGYSICMIIHFFLIYRKMFAARKRGGGVQSPYSPPLSDATRLPSNPNNAGHLKWSVFLLKE